MSTLEATRLLAAGQLAEAEASCRSSLAAAADDPTVWHLLGLVLQRSGRNTESAEALHRSVRLAPGQPYYRINLAAVLGALDRADEAVGQLAQAMLIKGDIPELHNNLGRGSAEQRAEDEARLCRGPPQPW
jgi:predicted Zn-dependent protease